MSNTTRFDLIEIDDVPAVPATTVHRIRECPACAQQATLAEDGSIAPHHTATGRACDGVVRAPIQNMPSPPPAPAVDPIDAFATRARAERAERVAQGLPARLDGPTRQPLEQAPVPVAPAAPARQAHEQIVAVGQADETTGAVVYWSISGDLDLAHMTEAWAAAGLPVEWLPAAPSPRVAIGRAAKSRQSRTCLVRQHPEGGWAFVHEDASGSDLAYSVGVRVWLDEDGSTFRTSNEFSATSGAVRVAYERALATVDGVDVSAWLTRLVGRLDAVSLRATGGVYFIPRHRIEQFHQAKAAVTAASGCRVFEIPALKSSDAVAAVLDAITREVDDVAEQLRGELEQGIGPRAVRTRVEQLHTLTSKIASYERLLGQPMAGALGRISKLHADLAKTGSRGAFIEVD